jgi:hypothetical protein
MAVRAQQAQVCKAIVVADSIDVVKLEDERST